MKKIKYPAETGDFHTEYIKLFGDHFSAFVMPGPFHDAGISLNDILTGNFDALLEQLRIIREPGDLPAYMDEICPLFDYEIFQTKIAKFFMRYASALNLSTCFYCNIDHINAFEDIADYLNIFDLLNRGDREDLAAIDGIGLAKADLIIAARTERAGDPIISIEQLNVTDHVKQCIRNKQLKMTGADPPDGPEAPEAPNEERMRNHFTLDHLIPKGKFPLFSLSLYNLVPCCYSCNSKFKGIQSLFDETAVNYLSPSSGAFSVDQHVIFKLLCGNGGWPDITKPQDFALYFEYTQNAEEYRRYMRIFKLAQRYVFHKTEIVSLIKKRLRYSDSRLEEIARLTGVPADTLKADIFGEELFSDEVQWRPLTKLKRDIARDIGLL